MRFFRWLKSQVSHKLEHLRWSSLKKILKEHGLALVIIIVGWEIVEDVLFPLLLVLLGNYVHPAFYAGIPIAWIGCLHWLMVPLMWGWWIKLKGGEAVAYEAHSCDDHDHD